MRDEGLFLDDMVEAADDVSELVAGVNEEGFLKSKAIRYAVLQRLFVIGEAAARLSRELRDRHREVEWSKIIGFRNIAAHAYFALDWHVVWEAATVDAPALREKVSDILFWEFPETQTETDS